MNSFCNQQNVTITNDNMCLLILINCLPLWLNMTLLPLLHLVYLLPAPFGGHYLFPLPSVSWLISIWRRLEHNCSFNWWKIINLAKVLVEKEDDALSRLRKIPFFSLVNLIDHAISRCLMRFINFDIFLYHYLLMFCHFIREHTCI